MKKVLLTLAVVLLAVVAQAQIKLHDDGHVSLTSLTKYYGVQVQPNGYAYFRTRNQTPYGWGTNAFSNVGTEKQWIVTDLDNSDSTFRQHTFFVYGNGIVWGIKYLTIGSLNNETSKEGTEPILAEEALDAILQLQGYYFKENPLSTPEEIMESDYVDEDAKEAMIMDLEKRNVGLDASLLSEVFPDAVRTEPGARLCINYQAVTTLLIEAVKQQQNEIEALKEALDEHGMMKPK